MLTEQKVRKLYLQALNDKEDVEFILSHDLHPDDRASWLTQKLMITTRVLTLEEILEGDWTKEQGAMTNDD
jgi:hypothetical protein